MSLLAQIKKSKGKKPATPILNTTEKSNVISSDEEDLSEEESFNSEDSFKSVTASAKRRWENTHDHTLHPDDHQGGYYDINRDSGDDENNMSYDQIETGSTIGLDTIARYGNAFTTLKTSKKIFRNIGLPEVTSDMKTVNLNRYPSKANPMTDMTNRYLNSRTDMNGSLRTDSHNYRIKSISENRYPENEPISQPISNTPVQNGNSLSVQNKNLISVFDKVMEWDAAIDTWATEQNSVASVRSYKIAGHHFKTWNKARKNGMIAVPAQLTAAAAMEFKHYITKKELSQNSKRTFVSAWKSFLSWLHEQKMTNTNLGSKIKSVKCVSKLNTEDEYIVSKEELIVLINKAKSWNKVKEPLVVFLSICFRFGIRINAFLNLQRKAFKFNDNTMYSKGVQVTYIDKGEQQFVKWIKPKDFHLLPDGWLDRVKEMPPHQYLFPGRLVDTLTTRRTMSGWLKKLGIQCNIGIVKGGMNGIDTCILHPHTLRHSGAMHVAKQGDIVKVQQYLGHANLETVRWYLHACKDEEVYNSDDEEEQPTRITSMNWQRTERNRRTTRQVEVPQEVPSQREYVEAYLVRAKEKYGTLKFREEGFGRTMVEKALRKYNKKYKNVAI